MSKLSRPLGLRSIRPPGIWIVGRREERVINRRGPPLAPLESPNEKPPDRFRDRGALVPLTGTLLSVGSASVVSRSKRGCSPRTESCQPERPDGST